MQDHGLARGKHLSTNSEPSHRENNNTRKGSKTESEYTETGRLMVRSRKSFTYLTQTNKPKIYASKPQITKQRLGSTHFIRGPLSVRYHTMSRPGTSGPDYRPNSNVQRRGGERT